MLFTLHSKTKSYCKLIFICLLSSFDHFLNFENLNDIIFIQVFSLRCRNCFKKILKFATIDEFRLNFSLNESLTNSSLIFENTISNNTSRFIVKNSMNVFTIVEKTAFVKFKNFANYSKNFDLKKNDFSSFSQVTKFLNFATFNEKSKTIYNKNDFVMLNEKTKMSISNHITKFLNFDCCDRKKKTFFDEMNYIDLKKKSNASISTRIKKRRMIETTNVEFV